MSRATEDFLSSLHLDYLFRDNDYSDYGTHALDVVCNFSPRCFAGASLAMNNYVFDVDAVVVNQNKWRARAFVGMRL